MQNNNEMETTMSKTDNKISVRTLLFGSETREDDGFHDLDYYHNPDGFKSFEAFKDTVESLLDIYWWDSQDCTTVNTLSIDTSDDRYDPFLMPDDETLKLWYDECLAKAES